MMREIFFRCARTYTRGVSIILEMTKELQNLIREYFTFQFHFIGSSSRNMITYDVNIFIMNGIATM
jgi:hypothetical protein